MSKIVARRRKDMSVMDVKGRLNGGKDKFTVSPCMQ